MSAHQTSPPSTPGRLRIGVIGLGHGARVLVPAFRMDSRCEVAVLCGRDPVRGASLAAAAGVDRFDTDWAHVVSDLSLDAIAVAVPPDVQVEMGMAALRARKHLFCEKPIASSLDDAQRLCGAAAATDRATAVDFELAETDGFKEARRILSAGQIGAIRHGAISWHVETRAHRNGTRTWKVDASRGGGTLGSFVSHVFHYVEFLLGPIVALRVRLLPSAAQDDAALLWLQLKTGAFVAVTVAANAPGGTGHRVELYGDSGALILDNPGSDYATFELTARMRDKPEVRLPAPSYPGGDSRIAATSHIINRFVDAALGGDACRPGLAEGLRVQYLIDAAKRAHDTGRLVEVGA